MSTHNLPSHVSRTIRRLKLFSPGDTVIVALSGGADSCALLDILSGLSDLKPRLVVAHLNHCLRGDESDTDEMFARTLADHHALPFESARVDIKEFAGQQGLNLEDAGRRARIGFLDDVGRRWQAATIALAHHADDQAETVLMRLLRGSGSSGLAGMPYRNQRGYIRPLLDVTRAEIEAYLEQRGLGHREDASNRDTRFLRNRIRHELLPALGVYNPALRSCLTATAGLLADENEFMEQLATDAAATICSFGSNAVSCSIKALLQQPPALRRRIFRTAIRELTGSLLHFSHGHIEALERMIVTTRPNSILNMPQGVIALREYDLLTIRPAAPPPAVVTGEFIIDRAGSYALSDGGSLTVEDSGDIPGYATPHVNTAFFDIDRAPFPWHVRTFTPGDRIAPTGMNGSKKVKELFIEKKLPHAERRRTPLIFCGDTLIWVCGLRSSRLATRDDTSINNVTVVYDTP